MPNGFLYDVLLGVGGYAELLRLLAGGTRKLGIQGVSEAQSHHLAAAIRAHTGRRVIYIAKNELRARAAHGFFARELGERAAFLPPKELMLFEVEAKSHEGIHRRISAFARLVSGGCDVLVTCAEAICQPVADPASFSSNIWEVAVGKGAGPQELAGRLTLAGYERVATVENKGQYAVRGGIVDAFPVQCEEGYRIEYYGDEVDSIRKLNVYTQRSVEAVGSLGFVPAREVTPGKAEAAEVAERVLGRAKAYAAHLRKGDARLAAAMAEKAEREMERLVTVGYFPGIDCYLSFLHGKGHSVFDYCSSGDVALAEDLGGIKARIGNVLAEYGETCSGLLEKGRILPDAADYHFTAEEAVDRADALAGVELRAFDDPADAARREGAGGAMAASYAGGGGGSGAARVSLEIKGASIAPYMGNLSLLAKDVTKWRSEGKRIALVAGTAARGQALASHLRDGGLEIAFAEDVGSLAQGQAVVVRGGYDRGFAYPEAGFVLVGERDAFGRETRAKARGRKAGGDKIKAFTDLSPGDHVVHEAHGIGRYVGMERLTVDGAKRDYLKIAYGGTDCLYIPAEQLGILQKYIGPGGKEPKVSRLGGEDWARAKSRVKESLMELAGELIRIYAARQAAKGHAFAGDTVWQGQMEDLFEYEETGDQLKCIEEIKSDMEAERPMDRLLCGDVGYGKTEVALRAVFKCAMDGKQSAYLVPTTILAQQHYDNFKARLADFPVKVEMISRFRTQAQQKAILTGLREGSVDILVGTHRLLQQDISFKDLGLLVVDEEQRFGVMHKDLIKRLRPDVDILSLSATPIPRTLHMSLTGIRDISLLEDPPEERYPVQTYVMEYDKEMVRDAIQRELARDGQVFYLHNKVRGIDLKVSEIQEMVPGARIVGAHGQMSERGLESIMERFMGGEFDILVCTTIIESGLDIPNVNTIIVENADHMGLAQLYQIRGRVGRSNRLAHAYITYRKGKELAEVSAKRLQAIREFTELGSGFKIAMRDMEIRGAGNLLGAEQHGNMDVVGYEMYCRLLGQAVAELGGAEVRAEGHDVSVDIKVSAYLDDTYVRGEAERIDIYRRIASIADAADASEIRDELIDRFGDIPAGALNLIDVSLINAVATRCGFSSVTVRDSSLILHYRQLSRREAAAVPALVERRRGKVMFSAGSSPYLSVRLDDLNEGKVLASAIGVLEDIWGTMQGLPKEDPLPATV